jgi:hypothetical protein
MGDNLLNLKRPPAGTALLNWNTELPSSGTGDPLGMTLRVGARLGAELLHCITSITPRARYYSFFPWAFQRAHERTGGTADFDRAMRLVLIDERAMTLGAVLHHGGHPCEGGGLQGSSRAADLVGQAKRSIDLGKWNHLRDNTSGFGAYKGSLINLGMFEESMGSDEAADEDGEEPSTTLESGKLSARGRQLAEAFGRAVAGADFVDLKPESGSVEFEVLARFGGLAGLCELRTADEFDLAPLRDLFFATDNDDQLNSHFRRRMSLLLLLWAVDVTSDAGHDLDAQSFDDLTYYRLIADEEGDDIPVEVPQPLVDIAERWRIFHFHNYLTTALETLLAGLVRAIRYHPAGRTVGEVLEAFDSQEARSAFGEHLSVDLPKPFLDLTPAELLTLNGINFAGTMSEAADVAGIFETNPLAERALRSALVDEDLVSGPAGPAIATVLLFTLLLRYELTVDETHKGWNRQKVLHPFADVSMPTVAQGLVLELGKDWWTLPNRKVLSLVLSRFVVRQHETMSYEKGFGGSPPLFRVDGAAIVGTDVMRDDVYPGNPRFPSALQVLRDLRLIVSDPEEGQCLTPDGKDMLGSFLTGAGS